MDNELMLSILLDSIKRKHKTLAQIRAICENQEYILLNLSEEERKEIFTEMTKEKQILIDEITKLDKFFQNKFEDISANFEQTAKENRKIVEELQMFIMMVTEEDTKIRLQEQKNKEILSKQKKDNKIIPKVSRENLLRSYNSNKKDKHDKNIK